MKKSGKEMYVFVLSAVLLFSIIMIGLENFTSITGYATGMSTKSNVSISKYLSIDASANLSTAIDFGTVNVLPAVDLNASHNYDGGSSGTTYWINTSTDSNTNVDFCIGANGNMASGADSLALGNETYANATSTSVSTPTLVSQTSMISANFVKSGENVTKGIANYYRFWLDIPAAQPSGDYNNTVYFRAVATGVACGSNAW